MKKLILVLSILACLTLNLTGSPLDLNSKWAEFVGDEGAAWRPHFQEGRVRSLYGASLSKGATSQESASEFLARHHELFGIDRVSDLKLERVEESEVGTHYLYQQYYGGLRVVGGEVGVHVNRDRQVIAVTSDYRGGLAGELKYTRGEERARSAVSRYLGGDADVRVGELMVYPMGDRARLVWRVEADSMRLSRGSWLMYVDASNPSMVLLARKTHSTVDGRGNIFLENPVVTPNRSQVTFKNMDGSKKLAGKFAQSYNANFEKDVNPSAIVLSDYTTASDPGRNYDYATDDGRLSEAMAFFHINKVHDQWRALGFNKLNAKAPVFVNVTEEDGGAGFDNAFYTRNGRFRTGIYVFGAGTVLENLGLDADVFYHEYGHGVLDHAKPGFFEAIESNYPGSFHEGFGDVSAAAITGNAKIGEWGLRLKSSKVFVGRNIDNANRFPQNVILPSLKKSEVHHTGLIFGGAWWDLQEAIGAQKAQNILLKALNMVPNETNFFDVRDAMLTADGTLNGGANGAAIQAAFNNHGLGGTDPGQPGTVVMNNLKVGAYNFNTGKITIKTSFKRTDTIIVLAGYRGNQLTPGYNLIPIDATLTGPDPDSLDGGLFLDEVVNGSHAGAKGAWQAALFPDSGTATGQYTISIQSRLGGSSKTTAKKSIKFKINP